MSDEMTSQVTPVKYLICVDASEHSRTAVRFACAQAKKRGGVIELLHILVPASFQTIGSIAEKMKREQVVKAQELLNDLGEMVYNEFGLTPSVQFREGMIEDEILSAVEEDADANLLVIGAAPDTNAKHGNMISWLVGHLGEELSIPVLLVPGNLTQHQIEVLS